MRAKRGISKIFATSTAVALTLSILTPAQAAQHDAFANIRIKNFGRINETYYRGAEPKQGDIADLAGLGVKAVIDLQQDGQAHEQEWVENAGMKFFRVGLSDSSTPSAEKAQQFL